MMQSTAHPRVICAFSSGKVSLPSVLNFFAQMRLVQFLLLDIIVVALTQCMQRRSWEPVTFLFSSSGLPNSSLNVYEMSTTFAVVFMTSI